MTPTNPRILLACDEEVSRLSTPIEETNSDEEEALDCETSFGDDVLMFGCHAEVRTSDQVRKFTRFEYLWFFNPA